MSEAPDQQLAAFLQRVPYIRFLGMRAELSGDEMTAIVHGIPLDDLPTSMSRILLLAAASWRK